MKRFNVSIICDDANCNSQIHVLADSMASALSRIEDMIGLINVSNVRSINFYREDIAESIDQKKREYDRKKRNIEEDSHECTGEEPF